MAIVSVKYLYQIIAVFDVFVLLTNIGNLVSGEDLAPLVLIDYGDGLDFPICARHTLNENGNYNDMDFTKENSPRTPPTYYCPIPENQRKNTFTEPSAIGCLVPSSTYGKCDEEVKPLMKLVTYELGGREQCGITRNSEMYSVGYRICTMNEVEVEVKVEVEDEDEDQFSDHSDMEIETEKKTRYEIQSDSTKEIYRFCFEKESNGPKYISYIEYRIISPTLLQNDALKEERILQQSFTDDMYNNRYYNIKNLEDEISARKYQYDNYMIEDTSKKYKNLATLAPADDMPFRLTRKPFFHLLNIIFLNQNVMKEWNRIGTYIRKKAIQQLGQVKIIAGIAQVEEQNGKPKVAASYGLNSSTILWKLVYTEKEYFAMAIIFQRLNFSWENPPTKLCERSLCEEYGWKNMISDHLKPYVYCCEPDVITTNIFRLEDALPLRLRENFKSLYHMSESECHDRNIQGEPALINIHDDLTNSDLLPVCARKLILSDELVYVTPTTNEQTEYYCPSATEEAYYILEKDKDDKYDNCLFKNPGKYQYCERPVQPILVPIAQVADQGTHGCVPDFPASLLYQMTFQLCRYDSYLQVTSFEYPGSIYTVCYNHDIQKTEYIEYRIQSPKLLKNPSLAEEQDFVEDLKTDSYNIFKDDFEMMRNNYDKVSKDPADFSMTKNYLVPPEDLAFRVWKRAAFHYINVKLMWPYWVDVWDSINQYLRHLAMEFFWEMEIKTGVLHEDDPWQKSIWWKLIHVGTQKAIAIILHNVPLNTSVKRLCDQNVCENDYWRNMVPEDKKDYVYCCPPSVITETLGMDSFPHVLDLIYASDVVNNSNKYKDRALLCENIPAS